MPNVEKVVIFMTFIFPFLRLIFNQRKCL
jgi:hypothetical protein